MLIHLKFDFKDCSHAATTQNKLNKWESFFSMVDTAREASTWQSSLYSDWYSSRTIDGNKRSCSHTNDNRGWLTLTFQETINVYQITVTNRPGFTERLNDFTLLIGDSSDSLNVCLANQDMSGIMEKDFICENSPMTGKLLKFDSHSNYGLSVCELEMYGEF